MRAKYARQIREGIKAARSARRLRVLWMLGGHRGHHTTLQVRAFHRTSAKMPEYRELYAKRGDLWN